MRYQGTYTLPLAADFFRLTPLDRINFVWIVRSVGAESAAVIDNTLDSLPADSPVRRSEIESPEQYPISPISVVAISQPLAIPEGT